MCHAAQEAGAQHPWVYWQEERKRNFPTSVALCCLNETRRFLLWILPPTSALHIPNLSEIASGVPEICYFKNWLSVFIFFFLFFFLFSHTYKNCYKTRTPYPIALKIWHTEGGYKGASRYQHWLEYDKQVKSYERLFTKNNTNMLSRLQGKPRMEKSWKSVGE